MVASLTLAYPGVLVAAGAVAAPVVIHLLMRTRPRRVIFPALRFVRRTHEASVSKLKLRHLLLLALRMLAILLIVLLLARPQWVGRAAPLSGGEPVAAVIVLDNSGSMGYRDDAGTRLGAAKAAAKRFAARLPAGSRVAVLTGGPGGADGRFEVDRVLAEQRIDRAPQTAEHLQLAPLVRQAAAMLQEVEAPRKAVLLATDAGAHAWRSSAADVEAAGVVLLLADVGADSGGNFAVQDVRLAREQFAVGQPTEVLAVVRGGPAAELLVRLIAGGQAADQAGLRIAAPGQAGSAVLELTADTPGAVEGRVELAGDDPLPIDNLRFFAAEAHAPRPLWVVRDPQSLGRDAPVSWLMALAIAPPGGQAGPVVELRTRFVDALATGPAPTPDEVPVILLADVSALPPAGWERLATYVQAGGALWVVPGDLLRAEDYASPAAQALLPVRPGAASELPAGVRLEPADAESPYLAPFRDDANPPLSDVRVTRRLATEALAPSAAVAVRFSDGEPAIVERTLGRGRVVWWNLAPLENWSNLAREAVLPLLAYRTAEVLAVGQGGPRNYRLGQAVRLPVPPELRIGVARVAPPSGTERAAAIDRDRGLIELTADEVGLWHVHLLAGPARQTIAFAVNADPDESDPARLDDDAFAALLPGPLERLAPDGVLRAAGPAGTATTELYLPALLLALAILTAESFLSNRFYRTVPTAAA